MAEHARMAARQGPVASLPAGSRLCRSGDRGPVWQVVRGAVRIDLAQDNEDRFVELALPGDLIGAECLLGSPYRFAANALLDSELTEVSVESEVHRVLVLAAAFQQSQERAAQTWRLREGAVQQRLRHLMELLGQSGGLQRRIGTTAGSARPVSLPRLRDLASIIGSTPETVCRYLGSMSQQPNLATG